MTTGLVKHNHEYTLIGDIEILTISDMSNNPVFVITPLIPRQHVLLKVS